jgi:hypothetical protein
MDVSWSTDRRRCPSRADAAVSKVEIPQYRRRAIFTVWARSPTRAEPPPIGARGARSGRGRDLDAAGPRRRRRNLSSGLTQVFLVEPIGPIPGAVPQMVVLATVEGRRVGARR